MSRIPRAGMQSSLKIARIGQDEPADFEGTLLKAEAVVAAGLPEERLRGLIERNVGGGSPRPELMALCVRPT